jgi:hypothetical protein
MGIVIWRAASAYEIENYMFRTDEARQLPGVLDIGLCPDMHPLKKAAN